MYCRKCHYNLRGLSEPRCPECGRRFNPADPRTYLLRLPGPPSPAGLVVLALLLIADAVTAFVGAVMVSCALASTPPHDGLIGVFIVCFVATPVSILLGIVSILVAAFTMSPPRMLRVLVAGAAVVSMALNVGALLAAGSVV